MRRVINGEWPGVRECRMQTVMLGYWESGNVKRHYSTIDFVNC